MSATREARPEPVRTVEDGSVAALPRQGASGPPLRRALVAGPLVAVVGMVIALGAPAAAALPLGDRDRVAGRRLLVLLGLVALLVLRDIAVRAARRSPARLPSRAAIATVRRERWT